MRLRLIATAIFAVWATVAGAEEAQLLVTVGEVTESSAVMWVRGRGLTTVALGYARIDGGEERQASVTQAPAADHTGKRRLTGLEPATRYRYRLSQGPATLDGEFLTAPVPDAPASVTFAWSGDLGSPGFCRPLAGGYPIFRAMARMPVDFFLFVGDTIYADLRCHGPDVAPGGGFVAKTLPQYQAKHRYNRADPAVQDYFRRTSVCAS